MPAALLAALAVTVLPAAARAATVSTPNGAVVYEAGAGEANVVTLSRTDAFGPIIVIETRARLRAGTGCVEIATSAVRCDSAQRADIRLGDGDDALSTRLALPTVVDGGAGRDRYVHAFPAELTSRVDFHGGSGVDTADYGSVTGGDGVVVSKDGQVHDGRFRVGAGSRDLDNIRPDVENLVGSRFADVLGGSNDLSTLEDFIGGSGDDVMSGGDGRDFFRMGATADGADTILGGPGSDVVDYGGRTQQVQAPLTHGGADDGEPGERDELVSVETATGGRGGDVLIALPDSSARFELHGGPGGDNVFGAEGRDRLDGAAGRDLIRGGGGDDEILARDGELDEIDCGGGAFDRAQIDLRDRERAILGCERRDIATAGIRTRRTGG